ncbi:glutamine-rich protein 2 [Grus americana]|nr:glutamine-rich protein 2 [Grus americana]
MALLSLSQLLDVAIGTPEVGAVNFRALHSLLQAMLGHLGLQDLPALEQGCSPTPLLGGDQPVEAHPGEEGGQGRGPGTGHGPLAARKDPLQGTVSGSQVASVAADMGQMKKKIEEDESGISKAMALSQDLLEEISGMKAAQSRMGEDIRMIQEALGLENLQDAAGRLPSLHDQMTLDSDVKKLKERLSLYPAPEEEGSGGQSAPAEPSTSDVDTPRWGSSAPGLKGPGTQPVPRTSKGTPGTQPGYLGMQAGMRRASATPEKWAGAPSDRTRTSDADVTIPGTQPGSPGTQSTIPGTQPGSPGTQTTIPGTQPGSPGTQTTTPGMQPGTSGTQTTTPGTQPGSPGTQTTTPGMQPGSPGTQTTIPGTQPGSPGTQTTTPGMQPGTPGTQTTTPGMQPGTSGTQTTIPRMQPAPPGTQEQGAGVQPNPSDMEPSLPGAEKVPSEATPGALGTRMDATSTQLDQAGHRAAGTLSLTAQGFEVPLNAGPRTTFPLQEPAVPCGSSGSSSASSRYVETVEALRQIGQLGNLYTALKEQVAHLEATKSDNAELEKLRLLFPEGDQESITNILADLRDQVSSLQGLASDLQGEKGKIRQLEDAFGKLGVTGADWKVDGSDQVTLQLGSTLQEIKQELKELREQQETTKATLEQLVTKTADQLQEQLDKLKAMVESTGQEQAEAQAETQAEVQAEGQAACPICSTDIGVQVGQLLQRYEKLQELVDSFMSRQPVAKVVRQLPGRSQQDEELLKRIQATVAQVQGDYKKLSSVTGNLLDDRHQKQKDIEALFQSLERLEKEKADKEDLLLGIDVKADKTTLAGKVSRTQFEACVERLNEMIQETLSRVTGQEQGWHQVQRQLTEEMDSKLDRLELGPFRQQLEEHWKSILEQLKEKAPTTEADYAAGIKKQLLAHFHCMSCDRPLSMLVPGPHIVAIPSMPPLPPRLAGRPQTILELEQTQQHGHRERVAECAYPSVPRHCGGQHTLTHPLQRCPRLQPLPPGAPQPLQPPTLLPIKHDEMELLGQDGHIYRGRRDGQLPAFVGKEGSPRDKPKLSPRQWDPQGSGRLLSRPQSAGSSLSQPGTAASPEHRPASSSGRLSQASGLLPPLWTQRGGSSTPMARQDWESLAEPPPPQPPSRRASGSSQQQ